MRASLIYLAALFVAASLILSGWALKQRFDQSAKTRIAMYATNSKAENTWKAYQADLRYFSAWCEAHNLVSLPATPETVAAYLTDLAQT